MIRNVKTLYRRLPAALLAVLTLCVLLCTAVLPAEAAVPRGTAWTNPDTGYSVVIMDDANLLKSSDLHLGDPGLMASMRAVTRYGGAALVTTSRNADSARGYAKSVYRALFGTDSGTLFLIDMDNRELFIFSDGAVYRTITSGMAYTITDNVYRYASRGAYGTCAALVFSQINDALDGRAVAAPMRHTTAALCALAFGLLLAFIWAKYDTVTLLADMDAEFAHQPVRREVSGKREILIRRYLHNKHLPEHSDASDGTGGSSSGGSGGGGGGSSGGGGGHSF